MITADGLHSLSARRADGICNTDAVDREFIDSDLLDVEAPPVRSNAPPDANAIPGAQCPSNLPESFARFIEREVDNPVSLEGHEHVTSGNGLWNLRNDTLDRRCRSRPQRPIIWFDVIVCSLVGLKE